MEQPGPGSTARKSEGTPFRGTKCFLHWGIIRHLLSARTTNRTGAIVGDLPNLIEQAYHAAYCQICLDRAR
jgi:hypothetical protein